MKSTLRWAIAALLALMLYPQNAFAQAAIAGVVRDTSGAILPGVTVEATSPALIEKVRSVVTDSNGQYRVVDLRPGTYAVTFTLAGFSSLRRDGIELSGSFVATIDAELQVGALQETLTVTGNAPTIDVQGVTKQRVLNHEVIDTIPTGRLHYNIAVLVPGVTLAAANNRLTQDVGGSVGDTLNTLSVHGSRDSDMRVTVDGLSTANGEGAGQYSAFVPNMASTQEVTLNLAAGSIEQTGGGVQMNLIPREGGNRYSGTFFLTAVNSSFQGSNVTPELLARGLTGANSVKYNYDVNPGFGGPLRADRLWFYAAARWNGVQNYLADIVPNLNAGRLDAWAFAPDLTNKAVWKSDWRSANLRLTWQAAPKHKLNVFYDDQNKCTCQDIRTGTAPEAAFNFKAPFQRFVTVNWSSPMTNRLLLEAGISNRGERYYQERPPESSSALIQVVEQSTGLRYRGASAPNGNPFNDTIAVVWNSRATATYVTGTHSVKVGFVNKAASRNSWLTDNDFSLSYRFNNGVPNQLTMRATPYVRNNNIDSELGIFGQDQWSLGQLSLNLAARFDYLSISYPEQHLGPGRFVPARDLTFPAVQNVSWKDVTPRLGASYDLFDNGKTALKVTLSKYLVNVGLQGVYGDQANPVSRLANAVTRSWNDANRNFNPDCDLINPVSNGECGAMSDANFGKATPSTNYDPDTLSGWGKREFNWEFSTSVQHALTSTVSVDVGFFRRWYGNFTVIDNLAVSAADFAPFSVTAPGDSRLPGGGGYTIADLKNLNPDKVGRVDNWFTHVSNYGKQTEHWNGIDVTMNARLSTRLMAQGGISTGRTSLDNCDILRALPEVNPVGLPYCHTDTKFLTQVKGYAAYTIPRVEVQVSGTLQSIAGPQISANFNAPNAQVAPSLGRPLSGGAANVTVNLVTPGSMYGDRLNQLDLRVSKLFRIAALRARANADLYNALNGSPVMQENSNFAAWRQPQVMQQARIAKLSVQFDF